MATAETKKTEQRELSKRGQEFFRIEERDIAEMEAAVSACQTADLTPIKRALMIGAGMTYLRQLISGRTLELIKSLAGSEVGFVCDKDGYPDNVIRDCAITALMRGAHLIGNEWNIIAGRCYLTKQFFERILKAIPDVSDVDPQIGIPDHTSRGALVAARCTWKQGGKSHELKCVKISDDEDYRLCVRVNQGQGADAVKGKATRKLLAHVYARVTGIACDDEETWETEPKPEPQVALPGMES